jgi:XTP/dITP diphosphohydrolase
MNTRRHFNEKQLIIASHNSGKLAEISALLTPFNIEVLSAKALGLDEPEETGTTYLENALLKARAAVKATGLPALSDDSGLEVEALDGQPGLHTAPFTKEHGGRENVFALWEKSPHILANPRTTFVCVQVLAWPDGHYEYFEGLVHGKLVFPPRGEAGHGYDPVFIPDGQSRTLAELKQHEKNVQTHRSIALQKLIDGCFKE